jgi:hypothetical protein
VRDFAEPIGQLVMTSSVTSSKANVGLFTSNAFVDDPLPRLEQAHIGDRLQNLRNEEEIV